MKDANSDRPGMASKAVLLFAWALSLGIAVLGYRVVAQLPRAPGDWLFSGAIATASARARIGGPLLDASAMSLDLAHAAPATQRLTILVAALLLASAAAFALWRRGLDPRASIALFATIGFLPLSLEDPSAVGAAPPLVAAALVATVVSLVLKVKVRPWQAALVGAVLGAASVGITGEAPGLGAGIFVFGLTFGAVRANTAMTAGLLLAIGYLAVGLGLAAVVHDDQAVRFAASHWWSDLADGSGLLSSTAMGLRAHAFEGLLAAIGAGITLHLAVRVRVAYAALVFGVALVASLLFAAQARFVLEVRRGALERDARGLEAIATSQSWTLIPHALINVPLHVRPELVAHSSGLGSLSRHSALETVDLGDQIHLPLAWMQTAPETSVLRWTAAGPQRTDFASMLDIDAVPSVVRVEGELPRLPRTALERVRGGSLARILGQRGFVDGPTDLDVSEAADGALHVEGRVERRGRFFVLYGTSARQAIDERFLERGLRHDAGSSLDVRGAVLVAAIPGLGAVIEVEAGALDVRITRR